MILDIFSELQRAKPWQEGHERQVMLDAIEQAKLADAKGFGCWWTVEHHGAPEFSYSSAPELILTILSQHTKRIRLGHSGVLAPFHINHPVRMPGVVLIRFTHRVVQGQWWRAPDRHPFVLGTPPL